MTSARNDITAILVPSIRDKREFTVPRLFACIIICGGTYGAVMGTFGGFAGVHAWQPFYSAVKVPILIVISFGLCLPFFFILNTLAGLRNDFGEVVGGLLQTQAVVTIALASLSPYTAVWYCSTSRYEPALLFNAGIFTIASIAGQSILRRRYRRLIAANARHRLMLRLWIILYAFVGIQMGWVLRPFVGDPRYPARFFRSGAFTNAYDAVARLIWHVLTHRAR